MKQSSEVKKMYISQLEKMLHPETNVLEEPSHDRKSKGLPTPRGSTKRDPSYFKHVEKKIPTSKSEGATNPEKLICVAFLRKYDHFVSVSLINNCPIPTIVGFWFELHEDYLNG
ncbi:hypothetical protein ACET3Z_010812 [Daucus carota]